MLYICLQMEDTAVITRRAGVSRRGPLHLWPLSQLALACDLLKSLTKRYSVTPKRTSCPANPVYISLLILAENKGHTGENHLDLNTSVATTWIKMGMRLPLLHLNFLLHIRCNAIHSRRLSWGTKVGACLSTRDLPAA